MSNAPVQTNESKRKHRSKNPWQRTNMTCINEPTKVVFDSLGVIDPTNIRVWYLQTQKFSGIYITNEMINCMFDVPKCVLANILGVSDTFLKKHKDFFSYHRTLSKEDANAKESLVRRRAELILFMSKRGDSNSLKVLMEAELYSQNGPVPSARPSWVEAKKNLTKAKKSRVQVDYNKDHVPRIQTLQSKDGARQGTQIEDHTSESESVKARWEPFVFEESGDIALDYEIMDLEDIVAFD